MKTSPVTVSCDPTSMNLTEKEKKMGKKSWSLILMALCLVLACSVSPAEAAKEKGNQKCTDNIDNDGDNLIDSADPDCSGVGGGDPEFFVELVEGDLPKPDPNPDRYEDVCANDYEVIAGELNNIVIGENGLAFVPNDSGSFMTRFNTIGTRTFLDIT